MNKGDKILATSWIVFAFGLFTFGLKLLPLPWLALAPILAILVWKN